MIYLIGGPPKCGKTTLAKKLSRELKIPWISVDTLQNIIFTYTPKEKRYAMFPHKYLRQKNNDEFYSKYSAKQIIKNYIIQGKTSYNAISMMAETYLTDKDDFIVEGYQVTPEVVSKIFKKFDKKHIRAVFLIKHDEQKFVKNIYKSTTPNDWIIEKTKNEETFFKIAKMVSEYSAYFEREAKKFDLKIFNMDENFNGKIREIKHYLTQIK